MPRLALLSASGLRSAFGSYGKSMQVGRAAADGLLAARMAAAGATVGPGVEAGPAGIVEVLGADPARILEDSGPTTPAIRQNWLKAYPCCLQTHACIDAARDLDISAAELKAGQGTVVVHPVSRQAAAYDDVTTGLEARLSIPYTTAFTLLHGPPGWRTFDEVEDPVRAVARRTAVLMDVSLDPNACLLEWSVGERLLRARVETPRGSPARPLDAYDRETKIRDLGTADLLGSLDDPDRPAGGLAYTLGVR